MILDNKMSSAFRNPRINELFTEGSHHRNVSSFQCLSIKEETYLVRTIYVQFIITHIMLVVFGPCKLFCYVRKDGKYVISKYKIRKQLQKQEAYNLQRPLLRRFRRNKIIVTNTDDQWSADHMDMVKFARYNEGYMYVLVVIDVLSKFLWMRPLKGKKGFSCC